jgi:hypothetical protein
MDVGAPVIRVRALPRVATAPFAVAAVVAISSVLHAVLAWRRATPGYFPDEYMYAELGRSLLDGGAPLVRGGGGFLPLLYPLLTAPAWLWDSVDLAYRSIQGFNAVAMSLAAVPAFLLARRLRFGDRLAVAIAALAVALPELLYSSTVLAEPVAYVLALSAAAAVVAALERPLLRLQLVALAFAGLAAATRLQLAVIPLCYLAAVLAVGLRERRVRPMLREQWVGCGVTLGMLAVGIAAGLTGRIGIYGDLAAYRVDAGAALRSLGPNALVLAYAAGWVVVPGALLGLALALTRPRSRAEHAFGAFAAAAIALLLLQTSVVGDVGDVQERYAIYALPLLLCLFGLYASRGWPHLGAHAVVAGALAAGAAAVPLAGYAAGGRSGQSFVLVALNEHERWIGDVGLASLTFAVGVTVLSALALGVARVRPRLATPVVVVLAAALSTAVTVGAFAHYQDSRAALRAAFLPANPSWVDEAARAPVTMLLAPHSVRADVHTTLFWNRSVDRLALLAGVDRPDSFALTRADADDVGRLDLPAGFVLADGYGSTVVLRDAERVAAGPTKTLWRAAAAPQLQLLLVGRYYSGVLAAEGVIHAWPAAAGERLAGHLELRLSTGGGADPVLFRLRLPDGSRFERTIRPGAPQRVHIPVCSAGPWKAAYTTGAVALVHGALVGLEAGEPHLVDDASACD